MRKIIFAVMIWIAAISQASAETAQETVKAFTDGLITAMKAGKAAGYQGRATLLESVIDKTFDLPEMTRLVLGSAGKALAPEDMARITVSFRAYTIANYAKNFDGFSGEKFEIDEPRSGGATAIVVPTRMVSTDGAVPVELDYVMKGGPDHWRITDVLADGSVSQMAAKRAELVPVLKKDGADGLIAALDARTKAMAK